MKKALLILGLSALACSCNGRFAAGYMIEADWDSRTETKERVNELACVDVNSDGTYTVDNQGQVG